MPKYRVTAEFVDLEAGRRRFPGEMVEAPLERARVLIDKGVVYPAPLEEQPLKEQEEKKEQEKAKEQPGEAAEEESVKTGDSEEQAKKAKVTGGAGQNPPPKTSPSPPLKPQPRK